ncbi:MAG: hypothetical protein ACNA8L_09640 [Luteolibacter sp.]
MKLLLGATIALLFTALVLSWTQSRQKIANTAPDELQRLKQQIYELRIEQERIQLEREAQHYRGRQPATGGAYQQATDPGVEAIKAELAAKDAALRALEEEKARAERDAEVYKEEAGLVGQRAIERGDNDLRRARMIRDALLVARIQGYTEDEFGGFCSIELLMPENLQSGMTLAIRRNTGILGHLRITRIEGREAIATPMPGFGPVDPQPGDELIIPPPFD